MLDSLKLGWLSRNSGRKFPLDDTTTAVSDKGVRLEDDVITDLKISWPESLGQYAFVSFVSVTSRLVSIGITVSQSATAAVNCVPIANMVVNKTAAGRSVQRLSPMQAGVAGFVTFGDTSSELNLTFSSPQQSRLSPSAGSAYPTGGVSSLSVPGAVKLTGNITLIAGNDISIRHTTLETDGGAPVGTAIVIGLNQPSAGNNTLSKYVGDCARRPENGDCPTGNSLAPAIQTINGISASCDRNIRLVFEGGVASQGTDTSYGINSLVVNHPHTLEAICASKNRNPNVAAVLDACSDPVIPAPGDCEGLPANYKLDGTDGDRELVNWNYHDSLFTQNADGVTFQRRFSINPEISYVGGLASYDSCGYQTLLGRTVSAIVTVNTPSAPSDVLIAKAGAGLVINYLRDEWLYKAINNFVKETVDPKIRVGIAVYPVGSAEFSATASGYNYVAFVSKSDVVLQFVKLRTAAKGETVRFRVTTTINAGATSLLTSLNVSVADAAEDASFDPQGFTQVIPDFGPPVGRVGVFSQVDMYTVGSFSLT